ncbi:hypothetical protein KUCAC02_018149 [Chaenocephalus aceratus]|uniref:Uncharacterized protein n=1 Tax=Chaenocephalus aceratus TaxID=36190 RepID=A0ACB9W8G2_CHAAC|nr:hypothetical protein KUCAC02_018149 [Chaenocephalus aceratus]
MPDLGQASQPEILQVCSLTSTWDRMCYLSTLFSLAGRPTLCLPYYGNHDSHDLINESSYRAEHNDSNQSQKAEGLSTNQRISSPPPTMLALQIASECW